MWIIEIFWVTNYFDFPALLLPKSVKSTISKADWVVFWEGDIRHTVGFRAVLPSSKYTPITLKDLAGFGLL